MIKPTKTKKSNKKQPAKTKKPKSCTGINIEEYIWDVLDDIFAIDPNNKLIVKERIQ